MINVLEMIEGKSFENKSAVAEVVRYPKKVGLLRRTAMLTVSAISNSDLTGISIESDVCRS